MIFCKLEKSQFQLLQKKCSNKLLPSKAEFINEPQLIQFLFEGMIFEETLTFVWLPGDELVFLSSKTEEIFEKKLD